MKLAALQFRDFRNLWIGQTVSQLGDAIYGLLFIFMADRITQRPEIVGGVGAATALPFLLLSPYAGVLADRSDRRSIMLWCDLASAGLLLGFFALLCTGRQPPLWSLFTVPFLLSCVNAFFLPARGAVIPSLVPPDTLMDATSLSQATMSLMHTVGLVLAAVLLGPLSLLDPSLFFGAAVLANLVTFLVSAWFVRMLPPLPARADGETKSQALADLREGLQLVRGRPDLLTFLGSNLLINLAVSGFMVVYTATNRLWFGGSFQTLAFVEATFLVSMVVGSLIVPRLKIRRVGVAYVVALALIGVDLAYMGFARTIFLYSLGNVVAGLALPFVNIPFMTYLNLTVAPELRGRLNSLLTMASAGVQPFGAALSGASLKVVGIVGVYLLMGAGTTAASLAPLAVRPFRQAALPDDTQDS